MFKFATSNTIYIYIFAYMMLRIKPSNYYMLSTKFPLMTYILCLPWAVKTHLQIFYACV